MSTTIRSGLDELSDPDSTGVERSEPVGRAKRRVRKRQRRFEGFDDTILAL
jgi:hypothetical protein